MYEIELFMTCCEALLVVDMFRKFFVKFQSTRIWQVPLFLHARFSVNKGIQWSMQILLSNIKHCASARVNGQSMQTLSFEVRYKIRYNLISSAISAANEILFQLVSNWYWLLQRPIASTFLESVHLVWISRVNCQRLFGVKNRKCEVEQFHVPQRSGMNRRQPKHTRTFLRLAFCWRLRQKLSMNLSRATFSESVLFKFHAAFPRSAWQSI